MLWHIFPASLKSNSAIEKKKVAKGHHRPPLAIMHVNLSQQNSCYLQLDKSPNLLLSGKEPARVRISASVFSQSFYCLFFFWMLQNGHLTIFVLSSKTGTFLSTPLLSSSQKRIYCISNSWSNPRPISSSHQEAKHGCLVRAFSDSMNSKGRCGLWSN